MTAPESVVRAMETHQVEWIDGDVGYACGCDHDGSLHLPTLTQARQHQADAVSTVLLAPIRAEVDALRLPAEGDQDFDEDPVACIVDAFTRLLDRIEGKA